MFSTLVQEHPTISLVALAVSCGIVGYLELLILKSIDVAAFAWFFGIAFIAIAVASFGGRNIASFGVAAIVGLAMLAALIVVVRRQRSRQQRQ